MLQEVSYKKLRVGNEAFSWEIWGPMQLGLSQDSNYLSSRNQTHDLHKVTLTQPNTNMGNETKIDKAYQMYLLILWEDTPCITELTCQSGSNNNCATAENYIVRKLAKSDFV